MQHTIRRWIKKSAHRTVPHTTGFNPPGPLSLTPLTALTALSALDLPVTPRAAILPPPSFHTARYMSPYTQLIHLSADEALLPSLLGPRPPALTSVCAAAAGAAAAAATAAAASRVGVAPDVTADASMAAVGTGLEVAAAAAVPAATNSTSRQVGMDMSQASSPLLSGPTLLASHQQEEVVGALGRLRLSDGADRQPQPQRRASDVPAGVSLALPALRSLSVRDMMPQALCPFLPRLPHLTRLSFGGEPNE